MALDTLSFKKSAHAVLEAADVRRQRNDLEDESRPIYVELNRTSTFEYANVHHL